MLGLLDALQIDAAHLVGHDHGAAVAQLLAADHPTVSDGWSSPTPRPTTTGPPTRNYRSCASPNSLAALPGLRRFDHPTLLIWGRDDPHFGPRWAQRLHADIPGAHQLELLPATGHLLMEEQPERLAALIADFLTEPRGTPTPPATSTRPGRLPAPEP